MARLVGVDLPRDKRIEVGLTYIYGIGLTTSKKILAETGVDPSVRVKDLTEDDLTKLRDYIQANIKVEGCMYKAEFPGTFQGAVIIFFIMNTSVDSARTRMRARARVLVSKSAERKSEVVSSGS